MKTKAPAKKPRKQRSFEEHRQRHVKLHRMLDELVADWIGETGQSISVHPIMDLMLWSQKQTGWPDDKQGRFGMPETRK